MKFFEKMMALLLSLAAVLSFAMPAFAEENLAPTAAGTHTITISFEKPGHEYVAYQVFKGDYYKAADEEKGHLSNIEWGSGVKGDDLLGELKSEKGSEFANAKTAADVADILAGYGDSSTDLDAFAKVVANHLSNTIAGTSQQQENVDENGKYVYKITGLSDGYYFVKDKNELSADANDANTKYILQVLGDVQINAKADVPDIEKKITDEDGTKPRNGDSYNVGDTVYFKLTSKVPDMDGYDSYTYKVTDTLSDGLTLVENEDGTPKVTVTIGSEEYQKFTATLSGNVLTIDFPEFIDQKENKGAEIVIRYEAVLNEKALQTDKESNSVHLEYSNDPNGDGTGKTTEKKTYVYNFDIDIVKHETGNDNKLLSGAEFVLYRLNSQNQKEYYNYNTDKKETEWKTLDNDNLETIQAAVEAEKITSKTTNEDGKISFVGLEKGTYYLQEIKAPDGYNLPADPVKVEITVNYNEDGTINMETSLVEKRENNGHMFVKQEIENKPGPVLPSTGGIGTTIFYVLGGILTVAAIVLLIVKKRMENTKR